MSNAKATYQEAPVSSIKMLTAMVGIGVTCALMIVLTYEGTLPRVERLKAEALEKAIFRVVPGMQEKVTYRLDESGNFIEASGDEKDIQLFHVGYDENGGLAGVAIEASGPGFADILKIIYGYDPEKEAVVGFYVLESKETPGLGDKIEKDTNFLANFKALDVSLTDDKTELNNKPVTVKSGAKENPWEVDGITGATISSRAIGNIIATSAENWVPKIFEQKEQFEARTGSIETTDNE